MKRSSLLTVALCATSLVLPMLAPAAEAPRGGHDHGGAHGAMTMDEGRVTKVDKEHGTITIQHGHSKSTNMPAMTMTFPVKDAALLHRVKAGDRVRFALEQKAGKSTITKLEPVKAK